jgi:hypothetical protein
MIFLLEKTNDNLKYWMDYRKIIDKNTNLKEIDKYFFNKINYKNKFEYFDVIIEKGKLW